MPDAKGRTMGQMQEPRIHDALRAKLAPAYNGRDVLALEPGVNGNVEDLKQLLRRRISQGGDVDLVDPIAYFAVRASRSPTPLLISHLPPRDIHVVRFLKFQWSDIDRCRGYCGLWRARWLPKAGQRRRRYPVWNTLMGARVHCDV